jgi:AcrR family transcriptional regulator
MPASPDFSARDKVLAAAVCCAGSGGIATITVEEVARESGVSRATVYRWFPGGREQIIDEGITWEIGRFLARVAASVDGAPDLATRLERALVFAHRALEEHEVLQRLLATEPGGVLPQIHATAPLVVAVVRDELRKWLADEPLRSEVDADEAAEYLARIFLSFVANQGSWDLTNPAEVHELVRSRFLAGVLA